MKKNMLVLDNLKICNNKNLIIKDDIKFVVIEDNKRRVLMWKNKSYR